MEHINKGEMFNMSVPYNDNRFIPDHPEVGQSIGAGIAFVVVIIGWAISKIFGRDLLG
jgi:hypothetical protein